MAAETAPQIEISVVHNIDNPDTFMRNLRRELRAHERNLMLARRGTSVEEILEKHRNADRGHEIILPERARPR